MSLLSTGKESCSEKDCPLWFCSCMCHTGVSMMHCMPCCHPATCSKCGKSFNHVNVDFTPFDGPKEG